MRVDRDDISFHRDRDAADEVAVCALCRQRLAAPSIPVLTVAMQQHLDLAHYVSVGDEWLERAAREIGQIPEGMGDTDDYLHILRKHRDGEKPIDSDPKG